MSSLWERIKGWKEAEGKRLVAERIGKDRVDVGFDDTPLVADQTYVRIWLAEMGLGKSREWFKDWHPVAHGLCKLRFADQELEVARVAAASQERFQRGEGVLSDFVLLDLAPFPGGVISVEAALLGLPGKDLAARAIAVLADFATLVSSPLSLAIEIAAKVKRGADQLLGADSELRLCYQESFTSGSGKNELRPGYVAVVRAETKDVDPARLSVRQGRLLYEGAPLTGHDFMLLRIEGRAERDDWRHFRELASRREKVIEAHLTGDAEAPHLLRSLLAHVLVHPDLAIYDRKRIALALRQEVKELTAAGNGAAGHQRSWDDFTGSLPAPETRDRSPLSLASLLED